MIGVEENDGRAIRPVKGIDISRTERIGKEMIGFNNLIMPYYQPRVFFETVDRQTIMVIWVSAGERRPYKVPEQVTSKEKRYNYYIRYNSSTIVAKDECFNELIYLANKVPFDDRGNPYARIEDVSMLLIRDYLAETGSNLGINGNYPVYYFAGIYEGDFADETATVTDRSAFFLNHDEATGTYSMVDNECFISGKDRVWGFPVIGGKFTPFDVKAGEPEPAVDLQWNAENCLFIFKLPMTDTEGNALDPYLLRYSVYVNGKKHTFDPDNSPLYGETIDEMPANLSRFFSFETDYRFGKNPDNTYALIINTDSFIESLGVQQIYDVLGDVRQSEMAEMKVAATPQIATDMRKPVAFYGLDGCPLTHPSGVCIVRYSDGSVEKVLVNNR